MNSKNKQIIIIGIAIIIVIIIILTSLYYSSIFYKKEPIDDKIDEILPVDDRISPLTNQGVVLEILRIRHRGLIDEIVKMGLGWKKQPTFYFISNIDDQEYISKDIEGAGGVMTEIPFVGWDTIFQENKIMRDAEEEQEKSYISLRLMEIKKKGLLGRKTDNIQRDSFEIIYDYKTGYWTGDDYLGDDDGLGHYLGETFEIWFNVYQIDYDGDKIPYWMETNVYHTNPQIDDRHIDHDGDGIPTAWEWKYGYDPMIWDSHCRLDPDVDGIENIEEYKISKWFSDPFSTDIYIEVDGMQRGGLLDPPHYMYKESIQILIERFAQHGLNLYFDDGWPGGPINGGGELVRHVETLSQDAGQFLQYYNNNFADERKGIFRYCIIGHNTGFSHPSDSNKVDCLTADTSRSKNFKRGAFTPRTQRIFLASGVMHELGHSLGIHSWTFPGVDSGGYDFPEYKSIMNYMYIFSREFVLDYSDGDDGDEKDQDDWSIIYPPHFQDVDVAIEEPYFYHLENPEDYIVDENPKPILKKWKYDANLTESILEKLIEMPKFYFENYEHRIYVSTEKDTIENDNDIRLYIKPDMGPTYTTWVLVKEYSSETFETNKS